MSFIKNNLSNSRITQKEISHVLESILSSSEKDDLKAFRLVTNNTKIKSAIAFIKEGKYEDFNKELVDPISQVIDGLLIDVTGITELRFLIKHSDFVVSHFRRMFKEHEGELQYTHKTSTVMDALFNFYLNNEKINFDYDQSIKGHLPKKIFKTHDEIVSFFISLIELYNGINDKYLIQIENLNKK